MAKDKKKLNSQYSLEGMTFENQESYRKALAGSLNKYNAYKMWTSEEDNLLLSSENKSVKELASILKRRSSAIRSRQRKLEIKSRQEELNVNNDNITALPEHFDILSYSSFTMTNKSYQLLYDRKRIELLRKNNEKYGRTFNSGLPITYEENDKLLELINNGYKFKFIKRFFLRSDSATKDRMAEALSGSLKLSNTFIKKNINIFQDSNFSTEGKRRLQENLAELEKKKRVEGYITANDIRTQCMVRHQIREQIERGRKPLSTLEECEQYWWSFSKFISQQWEHTFKEQEIIKRLNGSINIISSFPNGGIPANKSIQIIDYGSGQGLASLIFLHKFLRNNISQILDITLIDKSSLALSLARRFLGIQNSEFGIKNLRTIYADVNNISTKLLETKSKTLKIHLFSNILDIGVIDQDKLLNEINKTKGKHLFFAASQGSNYKNGSKIFKDFYNNLLLSKYKFKIIEDIAPKDFPIQASEKVMNGIFFVVYAEVQ